MNAVVKIPQSRLSAIGNNMETLLRSIAEDPILIGRICDALMVDVDILCAVGKEYGGNLVRDTLRTRGGVAWTGSADGSVFLGFVLNESGFDLGFLTEPVLKELRTRLERATKKQRTFSSESDSIGGTVTFSGAQYETPSGTYQISHTHSWYVEKKV